MSTHEITFRHVDEKKKSLIMQNRGGQSVIARILKAYGFSSRQAFCNHLGISQSTMANRYARDTFPADWVVICSMETGVPVEWLAFGTDTEKGRITNNAEKSHNNCDSKHQHLNKEQDIQNENFFTINQGGKAAIERIVLAYGFKTRQALADHIGVSKSTLANRYMRDTFPADWIIQCSLETGASLTWLTTGNGAMFEKPRINTITIPYHKIIDGSLAQETVLTFDSKLLEGTFLQPLAVFIDEEIYIVESKFNEVTDGKWLVNIEGKISIKDLTRIPVGMVKVVGTNASFECLLTDIIVLAKCKRVFTKNV